MRLALTPNDSFSECYPCNEKDEYYISSYILCYQAADYLLKNYAGTWDIEDKGLTLTLAGMDFPLYLEFNSGSVHFDALALNLTSRYSCQTGIKGLMEEILKELAGSRQLKKVQNKEDELLVLFVKLVEIFHARCGLCIRSIKAAYGLKGWEITLEREGAQGWVSRERVATNRWGETARLEEWASFRPEKRATRLFGFNRYCCHYPSPLDKA